MQDCNYVNDQEYQEIIESRHKNPHNILGRHIKSEQAYINAFYPNAVKIEVVNRLNGQVYPMRPLDDEGFFSLDQATREPYYFRYTNAEGQIWEREDPYSFPEVISEFDRYLFGEGNHYEIYKKLGAHSMVIDDVQGVLFAVWAPNAERVSVVGDFCGWDGRLFMMRELASSGIFELFIPRIGEGEHYKYEIKTKEGHLLIKTDPYGTYAEKRPATASIVYSHKDYEWTDQTWQEKKKAASFHEKPLSIYEVHLGSWKVGEENDGFLNYRDLAPKLAKYVHKMGYTHIELMPVMEHPFDGSWGYQVTGYYAPTSRYGKPDDFKYFVDYMHKKKIGVLLDWVPGHFPKDGHGLAKFDGTALYEHSDPRQGEHPHWGTLIYNYGRREVSNFLIANALYWIEVFHIDGLRADAVASMLYLDYGKEADEWVPNEYGGRANLDAIEFFKHLNKIIYERNPGTLMVAEESTAWPGVSKPVHTGGLGFGFKWNMGWMNDFLRYMSKEPIHRKFHHNDLTFSMVYAYTENFILVLSHDEVVHGKGSLINKMPGDYWQKFANVRCAFAMMFAHPGKKLMFMGNEIGQFDEWAENREIEWGLLTYEKHKQLQDFIKKLNHFYVKNSALWEIDYDSQGFEWINCWDADESIVSFLRRNKKGQEIIVVSNFTPVPRLMHRIGVPHEGVYQEVLNTDDVIYGGSGICNEKSIKTHKEEWDQRPYCLDIKLPPLGSIYLKKVN